jgi:hypothetical protein
VDRLENAVTADRGEIVGTEDRGVGRYQATAENSYDGHESRSLMTRHTI